MDDELGLDLTFPSYHVPKCSQPCYDCSIWYPHDDLDESLLPNSFPFAPTIPDAATTLGSQHLRSANNPQQRQGLYQDMMSTEVMAICPHDAGTANFKSVDGLSFNPFIPSTIRVTSPQDTTGIHREQTFNLNIDCESFQHYKNQLVPRQADLWASHPVTPSDISSLTKTFPTKQLPHQNTAEPTIGSKNGNGIGSADAMTGPWTYPINTIGVQSNPFRFNMFNQEFKFSDLVTQDTSVTSSSTNIPCPLSLAIDADVANTSDYHGPTSYNFIPKSNRTSHLIYQKAAERSLVALHTSLCCDTADYNRPQKRVVRKESKEIRTNRACVFCRAGRANCSPVGPCPRCVKAARGDNTLALRICFRDSEKAKEMRLNIVDLLNLQFFQRLTTTSCCLCTPRRQRMYLVHWSKSYRNNAQSVCFKPLILEVEECLVEQELNGEVKVRLEEPTSAEIKEKVRNIMKAHTIMQMKKRFLSMETGEGICLHTAHCSSQLLSPQYRIRAGSLPKRKTMTEWAFQSINQLADDFPYEPGYILNALLARYCTLQQDKDSTPLNDLVKHVMCMASLSQFVHRGIHIEQGILNTVIAAGMENTPDIWSIFLRCPAYVQNQLYAHAAKFIEQAEMEALDLIDNLLPDARNACADVPNRLILGLCVRALSLYYRDHIFFFRNFTFTIHKRNAQLMYDALIRHYCRIFHGKFSPFHADRKDANYEDTLLYDRELIERFKQLRKAEAAFYTYEARWDIDGVYIAKFAEGKHQNNKTPADIWKEDLERKDFDELLRQARERSMSARNEAFQ